MAKPAHISEFVRDLFAGNEYVQVTYSHPMIDVRAYPGLYEGKRWEIEICIDGRAPALPHPNYWSALGDGDYQPISDTGDTPPLEVVDFACDMVRVLRASEYQFAGMSALEKEAIVTLNNIVQSSNANDHGSLMNAIQDAQHLALRYFEDTSDPAYLPDEEKSTAPRP